MKPVIEPIDTNLIIAELTPERFLRKTNKGNNEIYIIDAHNEPNTMRELGRLREIAFRAAGGGTGKECDIDEFDVMPVPCRQLIVWNPAEKEIIGGYRFILGHDIAFDANGVPQIATSHMFHFSEHFLHDMLPVTIELGRSFVRLEYQSTKVGAKAIFALDNLWDGLGALTVVYPEMKYLFGKVTMYPNYSTECRDLLLAFLQKYFPDPDGLVRPIEPLQHTYTLADFSSLITGTDFKGDYKRVNCFIREHGFNIPPLVNAYMGLSSTMRMFGTAINHEFGEVEESGIFLSIDEITDEKKDRHIQTFVATH